MAQLTFESHKTTTIRAAIFVWQSVCDIMNKANIHGRNVYITSWANLFLLFIIKSEPTACTQREMDICCINNDMKLFLHFQANFSLHLGSPLRMSTTEHHAICISCTEWSSVACMLLLPSIARSLYVESSFKNKMLHEYMHQWNQKGCVEGREKELQSVFQSSCAHSTYNVHGS